LLLQFIQLTKVRQTELVGGIPSGVVCANLFPIAAADAAPSAVLWFIAISARQQA
jgi:hypothetical protein